jgi:hypothetical protein
MLIWLLSVLAFIVGTGVMAAIAFVWSAVDERRERKQQIKQAALCDCYMGLIAKAVMRDYLRRHRADSQAIAL